MLPIPFPLVSGLPLQNFNPHGYQPMHISNVQIHGVHKPDASLHRTVVAVIVNGNVCIADSKLDIDEPRAYVWLFMEKKENCQLWIIFLFLCFRTCTYAICYIKCCVQNML